MKKHGLIVGKALVAGLLLLLVSSCSMQKRVYRSGYYVEWLSKKSSNNNLSPKTESNSEKSVKRDNLFKESINKNNKIIAVTFTETSKTNLNNVNKKLSGREIATNNGITKSTFRNSVQKNTQEQNYRQDYSFQHNKKEQKKNISAQAPEDGKSQLIALLLCLFVGALGIHRFYLGYIGIGVIQLLTLGGCGIWALVDLIMILTGDLKPKDGDYAKKI